MTRNRALPPIPNSPPTPPTLEERRRAIAARATVVDQLPQLRTAAREWRSGLVALLAGLSGFGLVAGDEVAKGLDGWRRGAVTVAVVTALLSLLFGSLAMMRASGSLPWRRRILTTEYVEKRLATETKVASFMFRGGFVLLAIAICALAFASVLSLTGQDEDPRFVRISTVHESWCGSLSSSSAPGLIGIKVSPGVVIERPLSRITSVESVSACGR